MTYNVFDPFANISSEEGDSVPDVLPAIHVGRVKQYYSDTKTCMVLIPSVNDTIPLGPFRLVKGFNSATFQAPSIDSLVIVAFIDSEFESAVIIGGLA